MDTEPRPVHLVDHREPRRASTPILVVQDDPHLRVMFQLLLEGEGYPVVAATDGLEALRAVRTMRPSLVILDLELPLLDGQAVAFELRGVRPMIVAAEAAVGCRGVDRSGTLTPGRARQRSGSRGGYRWTEQRCPMRL